jgi:GAF domain-containing protein
MNAPTSLESVLVPLDERAASRLPDYAAENALLLWLSDELSRAPDQIFHRLADAAMQLTGAQSAGISLLDTARNRFVWPAVAGEWAPFTGGEMPGDFSPCGEVLARDRGLLFRRPERYFHYIARVEPPIEEALLVPFHIDGRPMGTLWVIHHRDEHHFDREDERSLTSLSRFTAAAYRTLTQVGALDRFLR